MYLNKDEVDFAMLQEKLIGLRLEDPDLNVVVRGSARTKYQNIVNVMDVLQQANVGKVNLATEPYPDGAARKE
jgi:biopolymer transport protein ExbD